jgi:hypothetical protein
MAVQTPTVIKSFFEQGDFPTQSQFSDFIDSVIPNIQASVDPNLNNKSIINLGGITIGGTSKTQGKLRVINTTVGLSAISSVTTTAETTDATSTQFNTNISPAGDIFVRGLYSRVTLFGSQTLTGVNERCVASMFQRIENENTASISSVSGYYSDINNISTGTIVTVNGFRSGAVMNVGGGIVQNVYCFRANDQTVGSITNTGFFGEITAGAGKYNLNMYGTAQNYLAGNLGLGTDTPTAYLHIKAGTATANTAPIKLTAGTNLTTPENGTFEFDGAALYFTIAGVRKTVTLV